MLAYDRRASEVDVRVTLVVLSHADSASAGAVPLRDHAEAVQSVRELPTREPYLGPGQGMIRVIGVE